MSDPWFHENNRLASLPAGERGRRLEILVDGAEVQGHEGETVAAVLLAIGTRAFRAADHTSSPRGLYCGIGLCYECLVSVDGRRNVRACITPIAAGMSVATSFGAGHEKFGQRSSAVDGRESLVEE